MASNLMPAKRSFIFLAKNTKNRKIGFFEGFSRVFYSLKNMKMITEIVAAKMKLMDTVKLKATPENLEMAYNILSYSEAVKRAKVRFSLSIYKGKKNKTEKLRGKYTHRRFGKNRILIDPSQYWLITLFHEFAHQLLFKDFGYAAHGKIFNKQYADLLNKYFNEIFYGLINLQNEPKK